MDDNAFATLTIVLMVCGGLLGVVVIGGGIAYAADVQLSATIQDKDCQPLGPSTVEVETKFLAFKADVEIEYDQCLILKKGNYVEHHIRTEHTTIYEVEGGACIWDTEKRYPC